MTNRRFYRNHHSLHDVTGLLPAQVASLHDELSVLHEQSAFLPGLPLFTGGCWVSTSAICLAT